MDGQILRGQDTSGAAAHTADAGVFQGAAQVDIGQEESSGGILGFFAHISRGFSATVNFLASVVGMLTLNFGFFSGEWAPVGWFVRGIIGIPMTIMFIQLLRG